MKFQAAGYDFKLDFQYKWPQTMATLVIDGNVQHCACAMRNPKDQCNRRVARKIVLARVLALAFPGLAGKYVRTEVWRAVQEKGMRVRC